MPLHSQFAVRVRRGGVGMIAHKRAMMLRVSCILNRLFCTVAALGVFATFSSASMAETHTPTGQGGRSTYSSESGGAANPCDVTRPVSAASIPSSGGSLYGETSKCYSLACCPEDRVPAVCSPTPPDCSARICQVPSASNGSK